MEVQTNWYVLFVMGGKEKAIRDFINEKYESVHAFIPVIEIIHTKQGEEYVVEKPMFPSYLFIESELQQKEFQKLVQNARQMKSGIIKELKYDEEISALREYEREYLEGLLNDEHRLTRSIGYLEQDEVVITEGPLKGYESHITRIDRHKKKAILNLDILSKETKITVSLEIIKKI